jgi:hypothetical protein
MMLVTMVVVMVLISQMCRLEVMVAQEPEESEVPVLQTVIM